jgi:hypothetical protein
VEAGTSAEAIEDPELRSQYEKAVADNRKKAADYAWQRKLRQLDRKFSPVLEKYLIRAYSLPPDGVPELSELLDRYLTDELAKSRILKSVKEQT